MIDAPAPLLMPLPPRVRIDRMNAGDIPDVLALDGSAPLREDDLRAELLRPWSRVWVAHDPSGEAVAILLTWQVVDEIHVLNLVTRVDHRRRGIGRAMMDTVIDYARGAKTRRILLEVRRSNAGAIALYRAVGFHAVGIRARYYPDDEDAVEMAAILDPEAGTVEAHPDEILLVS